MSNVADMFGAVSEFGNGFLQYKAIQQDKVHHEEGMAVTHKLHEVELGHATKLNTEALDITNKLHQESMDVTKKIYLWDTSTDMSQHFQQV